MPPGLSIQISRGEVWLVAKGEKVQGMLNIMTLSQSHPSGPTARAFREVLEPAMNATNNVPDRNNDRG